MKQFFKSRIGLMQEPGFRLLFTPLDVYEKRSRFYLLDAPSEENYKKLLKFLQKNIHEEFVFELETDETTGNEYVNFLLTEKDYILDQQYKFQKAIFEAIKQEENKNKKKKARL